MSKYFIIGEQGQKNVWVVDTQSRSVREVSADHAADAEFIRIANAARDGGRTVARGIDLAVASNRASEAPSHRLAPST